MSLIGSTTIALFGEDVDINDDARITDLLRSNAIAMIAPIPPPACKAALADQLAETGLLAVKAMYVMQQATLRGAGGIAMQTYAELCLRLQKVAELHAEPQDDSIDSTAVVLGADGDPIGPAPQVVEPDEPTVLIVDEAIEGSPIPDLDIPSLPQD